MSSIWSEYWFESSLPSIRPYLTDSRKRSNSIYACNWMLIMCGLFVSYYRITSQYSSIQCTKITMEMNSFHVSSVTITVYKNVIYIYQQSFNRYVSKALNQTTGAAYIWYRLTFNYIKLDWIYELLYFQIDWTLNNVCVLQSFLTPNSSLLQGKCLIEQCRHHTLTKNYTAKLQMDISSTFPSFSFHFTLFPPFLSHSN